MAQTVQFNPLIVVLKVWIWKGSCTEVGSPGVRKSTHELLAEEPDLLANPGYWDKVLGFFCFLNLDFPPLVVHVAAVRSLQVAWHTRR